MTQSGITTPTITSSPARPSAGGPPRPRPAAPTIDPVRILRQNVWRIVGVLVLGAGLGVGLNFLFASVYPLWSSQVLFEIRNQLEDANDLTAKDIGTEDTVIRLAQTEVARLTSKDIVARALQRPDIQRTAWSNAYRDPSGTFILEDAQLDLEKELRSGHRRGTQIFYISWSTHVPEDGPIVLNALADTYEQNRRAAVEARFNSTLSLYQTQLQSLDADIAQKKKDIEDFIIANRLTSLAEGNSANQRTLEKLQSDIAQTTAQLSVATSRYNQVARKSSDPAQASDEDKRMASMDPVLQSLERDMESLARREESVNSQFKDPDHPARRQFQAELDATRAHLRKKQVEVLARNLQADLKMALDEKTSLEALLRKQEGDFQTSSEAVRDFTKNMSNIKAEQIQLETLQERRKEVVKIIQDLTLARQREESKRVEVVQRALTPKEITFPQLKIMIPVTAVLLTGLFVGILFVRELLDQRVKYPSDLAAVPGKLLGAIPSRNDDPANPKRAELVVAEMPQSILAESFRQAAVQVDKGMQAAGAKTLLVLGTMPGAGTTTVVLNLASCETAVGRRVLMISGNMRRPGLVKALGMQPGMPGLGEILEGTDPASVVVPVKPGLDMISAGAPGKRVFERINSTRMDELLAWAAAQYDLVIIDGPPSVVAGEALTLANKADASLVVARAWQDQRGLIVKLAGQLLDSRSNFLGVMLNDMRMTAGGYLRKNAEAMARYATHTTAFGGKDEAAPKLPKGKGPKAKPA
ncbi:MAG: hypothetical protein RLZZ558_1302 [Planctomycetota bacterium]|jgi:uncharacterized protein involved in exopolysaccharide biosynthesis/Mrp family chromosome partitioning ATPase